jgi:hypothetical protein
MKVEVTVEEIEIEGDYDNMIPGVSVCCGRCGHTVEVYGTSDASIKRGCVMLREECPKGEKNFYVAEDA